MEDVNAMLAEIEAAPQQHAALPALRVAMHALEIAVRGVHQQQQLQPPPPVTAASSVDEDAAAPTRPPRRSASGPTDGSFRASERAARSVARMQSVSMPNVFAEPSRHSARGRPRPFGVRPAATSRTLRHIRPSGSGYWVDPHGDRHRGVSIEQHRRESMEGREGRV